MPYEHLNRLQRRQMAAYAKEAAAKRPETLTEIQKSRWPAHYLTDPKAPLKVFESRKYLVQLYDAGALENRTTIRLSICRVTLKNDGRWEEDLRWEELMQVKRELGFGESYAVEVYPQDSEIVNVANMRHLWVLSVPLSIGWFINVKGPEGPLT